MAARDDSFGKRLRKIREAHGLSQYKAAERCGIRASVWCRWERGNCLPTFATFQRIASGLELTERGAGFLVVGEGDAPSMGSLDMAEKLRRVRSAIDELLGKDGA